MPRQRVGDIELYYEITGQGPTLLFIHGLGSCTEDWEQQVAFFAQRFQVISFDVRGHGRSDKPSGPYSIPLFARDTVGLMDALGVSSAHVVGLSLGGMIAFQLAVDVPQRVDSLVIVNSGPAVPADTLKQRLPLYQRLLIIRLLGMRKMGKVLAQRLFPKPEQENLRQTFCERVAKNDKQAYLAALKAIFGWSVSAHLPAITQPTLVISADQDYAPVALKAAYVAVMPKAELVVIPDSRHALPLEKPAEFNKVVAAFLDRLPNEPH